MKKSKSLFGQLQNGGLYLRHPVDAGRVFTDVHIEKKPAKVHQSRLNSLRPLYSLWPKKSVHQRNQRLNFLRALGALWLLNYAKQTQFPIRKNELKPLHGKGLRK